MGDLVPPPQREEPVPGADATPREEALSPAQGRLVQVALVPPQGQLDVLDYVVPPDLAGVTEVGSRVVVPLGNRFAVGFIVATIERSTAPRLRSVAASLDTSRPLFDRSLVDLARWLANYYLGTISEAVTTMVPSPLRARVERVLCAAPSALPRVVDERDRALIDYVLVHGPVPLPALRQKFPHTSRTRVAQLCRAGLLVASYRARATAARHAARDAAVRILRPLPEADAERWQRQRPAAWRLYRYIATHPAGLATLRELRATFPAAAAKVRTLEAASILERVPAPAQPLFSPPAAHSAPVATLNRYQSAAVATLTAALEEGFRPFLLHGVTGSGKTEVYLRAAQACLERGNSVLILVPEISLTHQLAAVLRRRFGAEVALLHSGLSAPERWQHWENIAAGKVRVVAGARSAVFAPLPRLGLVIVDEEHDAAYKQEEGLRYHARDVAVVRARLARCPVVLASATPTMESYYNALQSRYHLLELPERVDTRPLPTIEVVDLRSRTPQRGAVPLSRTLRTAVSANLAAGQQSLLFLNRRGFARFLQCLECGAVVQCPNCSVSLTYHRRPASLQCHHCGHTVPAPDRCLQCGSTTVAAWHAGTEQVEHLLRELFPAARIGRLDRDAASRRGALERVLHDWANGAYDIVVGTQMIAKGHHVPEITLVGVLLADLDLHFPDFRAAERTFQLLVQVAGRAGRGDKPGRVLVQTYRPDDPLLHWAMAHDYGGFARCELAQRQELRYPPFARLVLARVESQREDVAERVARRLATTVRELAPEPVDVLGPVAAPLLRLRGWYRWHVMLRTPRSALARTCAARARALVRQELPRHTPVRIILDVDPLSLL